MYILVVVAVINLLVFEDFYKFIWAKLVTYAGEQDLKLSELTFSWDFHKNKNWLVMIGRIKTKASAS